MLAADECGSLTNLPSTIVCTTDNYDAEEDKNVFYQLPDISADADYQFTLQSGLTVIGQRDAPNVLQEDEQDEHSRRWNKPGGRWADYATVFVETGFNHEGDISVRSEADIEASWREGVTVDAFDNPRGIAVRHHGKAGNINIHVEDGVITSAGHGVEAAIDSGYYTNSRNNNDQEHTGNILLEMTGGSIRTTGDRGDGLRAFHQGGGDIKIIARKESLDVNNPDIQTVGTDAGSIFAYSWGAGFTAPNPTTKLEVMLKNFHLETRGKGRLGEVGRMSAGILTSNYNPGENSIHVEGSKIVTKEGTNPGIFAANIAEIGDHGEGVMKIRVANSTIMTAGDGVAGDGNVLGSADGIRAWIKRNGNVVIDVQDSTVETSGQFGRPINIEHWGAGDRRYGPYNIPVHAHTNLNVIRGKLVAKGENAEGISVTHSRYNSGSIDIDLINADVQSMRSNGVNVQGNGPVNINIDRGRIVANSGDGIVVKFDRGSRFPPAAVTIHNGARIEAATAVRFEGGRGTLTLSDSILSGNILFDTGNFDDQLTITQQASGQMGIIDFGDGDDMIDITVPTGQHFMFNGPIYGLNRFTQNGGGVVRFARAPFPNEDMTFNVNGGSLVVADKINLRNGELIIANTGQLVFEVGRDTTDVTWGQIFGDVRFEGDADPSVYIQFHPDAENLDALRTGLKLAASEDDDDDDSVPIELIYGRVTQGSETDNEGLMEIDLKSQPAGGGTAQTVGTVKGEGDEEDVNTRRRFGAMIDDDDDNDGFSQIARLDVPGSLPSLTSSSTSPPPSSPSSGGGTTSSGGGGAPSTPTPPVDPTPTPPPSATGPQPSVGDTTTTTWFTLTVPESMMPANPAERMVSGAYGIWMNCADAVCALRQGFESHARVSEALPAVLLDLNRAPLQGEQVHHDGTGAWASLIGTSVDRDLTDSTATTSYSLAQSGVRLGYDFETSSIGTFGLSLHRQTGTAAIDHGGDIDTVVTGVRLSHRWDMAPMTVGLHATATSFASDLMSFERGSLVNDLSGTGVAVGIEANQRRTLRDATLTLGGAVTHQRVSTDGFTAHLPDANAAAGVTPVQVTDVRGRETTARLQASYHTPMTDGDWFVGGAVDLPLHRSASVAVEDTRLSAETRPSLSLQGGLAVTGATGTTTLFSLGYAQESGGERVQAALRINF